MRAGPWFWHLWLSLAGSSATAAGSRQGQPTCEATAFQQAELEKPRRQKQCVITERLEPLRHIQRKGFGLRKEWSVLVGKGLGRKDNPGRSEGEAGNWKGLRALQW